jgi:hypothetical protein
MKFIAVKKHWALLCLLAFVSGLSQNALAVKDDSFETPEIYRVQKGNKASLAQIKNLKDDQKVELSNGRQVSAGRLKELANFIRSARSAQTKSAVQSPAGFSRTTAAAKIKVQKGYNLRNIENLNSTDTIQLPSGRTITASDFKKLEQLNKTMNGRSLLANAPALPNRNGPSVRVKSPKDLAALESKPDSTVIENAFGKKITVGELRAYAKKNNKPFGVK